MTSNKQFAIIKFQPNNILLLHKPSKRPYQYFEANANINPQYHLSHPALLRPLIYNNGLIYPKGKSTLQIQIENRKRAFKVIHFEQEEMFNTFLPIIECLTFLHQNNIIHGYISPASIVITEEDDIKLKDWLVESKENIYYFNKAKAELKKEDDWIALGQVILQAATLKKTSKLFIEKQIYTIVQNLVDKYSRGFIFAVYILLKKHKDRYPYLLNYLKNDERYLGDLELNSFYETIKREKDKKKIITISNENANIHANTNVLKPFALSLNQSPVKKSTPNNSLGNTLRRVKQDSENKKTNGCNEQIKKKQIQKINKIIERSNEFVNELMARKNNQQILKKIAPKPNIANISMYSQSYKKVIKESPIIGSSPNKKIRTISKKK